VLARVYPLRGCLLVKASCERNLFTRYLSRLLTRDRQAARRTTGFSKSDHFYNRVCLVTRNTYLDLFVRSSRWQIRHVVHLDIQRDLDCGAGVPVLLPELARVLIPGAKGFQFGTCLLPSFYGLIYNCVDLLADLFVAIVPQRFGSVL